MKVVLLNSTPLEVADLAIGKCWDKQCDTVNKERMKRVGIKFKHASTLEHITYNFDIDGISRACLQELARHRISSFSVKSTRYTLKEVREHEGCLDEFLVKTGNPYIEQFNLIQLLDLQKVLRSGISNDEAKYMIPEAFKTSLVWTINLRALRNFLQLRLSKSALWEIRDLANEILKVIPNEHMFLFEDLIDE
ncbi:MAG: FAD-dependent thymidylate synthase [Proteobacteria bacterium]|nr:FAD-dependent thymidylate synthase [Pseudomonadota bacterium]MCH9735788.1 FAD-dependent thymidylate synthase [Actinomycetes bacterium]